MSNLSPGWRSRIHYPFGDEVPVWAEHLLLVLFTVVGCGSVLDYTPIPDIYHVLVTVPAVFGFGLLAAYFRPKVEPPLYALVAFMAIWLILIPHAILEGVDTFAIIRFPVFMAGSFILLFVAPQVVNLQDFLNVVFYFAAVLTLIALPTALLGEYEILGYAVRAHPGFGELPLLGTEFRPLKSVFSNPNPFGVMTAFGGVAGLTVYFRRERASDVVLLAIVVLGLFLSLSRAAFLAFAAASAVLLTYRYFGVFWAQVVTVAGGVIALYFLSSLVGYVPDYFGVQGLLKYDRIRYWQAAIRALRDNVLFGIGFQPLADFVGANNLHNSYLYVFLTRGVVGGLVHFAFLGFAVRQALIRLDSIERAGIMGMAITVLVFMFFDSMLLFGFSTHAVFPALIFGYLIVPDTHPKPPSEP